VRYELCVLTDLTLYLFVIYTTGMPQIKNLSTNLITIIIIIIINYTSTYVRKQGYNWTKNTGMNMCQNQ